MKTVKISLNSIDKVKAFVIDAKSIMGIFSLDLSKPIDLNIHADGAALDTVMAIINKYVTE